MAAPAYTTDLTTINDCSSTTGFTEPTNATVGGIAVAETDFFVQNVGCISKTFNGTGLGGLHYNNAAGVTIPSDGAVMMWVYFGAPNAINTLANGGLRISVGSGVGAYKMFYVLGSDTYTYGGWRCIPVDPSVAADATEGAPTSTRQYFGMICNVANAVAKGNPFGLDAIRYGRCEARIANGSTADGYATFSGFATINDKNVTDFNRWGLIQAVDGGYLQQGLVIFGYGAATDFRDSNKTIIIANTTKVSANFNAFEVRNASSRVDWVNIIFAPLGTVSRGNFFMTDNATVNHIGCVFPDMGTFIYKSNALPINCTYRRCGQITQGGATITGCVIDSSRDAVSILASNPSIITGCTFTSDGSNHAMQATTAGDYNWNNTLAGYASSDGSTGNEAFYNNSGGHINLTVTGGTTPKVRNGAGATTTVIIPDVTLSISSQVSLVGAEIRIYDLDDTLPNLGTELAGTESHNASTYDFSDSAGNSIWIQIMLDGYEEFGLQTTMPSSDGDLVAILKKELNA